MSGIDVRGVCTMLQVFDMPASVRFYRDVLGFEIVQTSPRERAQFDWGLLAAVGFIHAKHARNNSLTTGANDYGANAWTILIQFTILQHRRSLQS